LLEIFKVISAIVCFALLWLGYQDLQWFVIVLSPIFNLMFLFASTTNLLCGIPYKSIQVAGAVVLPIA
jgi:ABC-type polysaccharide/polyol phosphate export permease